MKNLFTIFFTLLVFSVPQIGFSQQKANTGKADILQDKTTFVFPAPYAKSMEGRSYSTPLVVDGKKVKNNIHALSKGIAGITVVADPNAADVVITTQVDYLAQPIKKMEKFISNMGFDKGYIVAIRPITRVKLLIVDKSNNVAKTFVIEDSVKRSFYYAFVQGKATFLNESQFKEAYANNAVSGFGSEEQLEIHLSTKVDGVGSNGEQLNANFASTMQGATCSEAAKVVYALYSDTKFNGWDGPNFKMSVLVGKKSLEGYPEVVAKLEDARLLFVDWSKDVDNKALYPQLQKTAEEFKAMSEQYTDRNMKILCLTNSSLAYSMCADPQNAKVMGDAANNADNAFSSKSGWTWLILYKKMLQKELIANQDVLVVKEFLVNGN